MIPRFLFHLFDSEKTLVTECDIPHCKFSWVFGFRKSTEGTLMLFTVTDLFFLSDRELPGFSEFADKEFKVFFVDLIIMEPEADSLSHGVSYGATFGAELIGCGIPEELYKVGVLCTREAEFEWFSPIVGCRRIFFEEELKGRVDGASCEDGLEGFRVFFWWFEPDRVVDGFRVGIWSVGGGGFGVYIWKDGV
jgi:hypothetical protein